MADKFAESMRPPWAVMAWAGSNKDIYIELPVKDGPPYIMKFPATEGGLAKALKVMIDAHFRFGEVTRSFSMDEHPKIRRSKKPLIGTDEQRRHALDIVKRMKFERKAMKEKKP
jgi:hypothetical protein